MAEITELLGEGSLERIRVDTAGARELVREAEKHLASVGTIAHSDPDGAYALLWDATRKAITAHMLSSGLRTKSDRPGAHRAVVRYAEIRLAEHVGKDIEHIDRMRRTRNRSEYGPRTIGEAEVLADLEHARALVSGVTELFKKSGHPM